MKKTLISIVIFGLVSSCFADDRPNIIIILADDMGFSDIGCYGGEIETPNIDSLAKNGIKYTRFYNSARCCPTRASLMTGLHPHQTGIGWMTTPPGKNDRTHGPNFPGYQGHLTRNCLTIAEVLKDAGYATIVSGKWHFGMAGEDQWPLQRGFEKFYGCLSGATNYFYPEHPRGITLNNTHIERPESTTDRRYYTTDAFTDYAIKFIEENRMEECRPFFLYLTYTAPHWPHHAHQEEVRKYTGKYMKGWDALRVSRMEKQVELGLIDPIWKLSDRPVSVKGWSELSEDKKKEMDLRMANYAAMVDRMDQNIGKLIQYLKDTDQFNNTLIFFLSDNGGCHEGGIYGGKSDPFDRETWERTYGSGPSYGKAWANASNTPFREYKHFTHEGGIATPLVIHWGEVIYESDLWYREPAYLVDLMPTIIEVSGANYPTKVGEHKIHPLSGVSLIPSLREQSLNRVDPLYFEHEDNAAIMDGDWKLVGADVSIPDGPKFSKWELYNLRYDRTETHDLSTTYPQIVEQLAGKWLEWAYSVQVYPKPQSRTLPRKKQ